MSNLGFIKSDVAIGVTAKGVRVFCTPEFQRALGIVTIRIGGATGGSVSDFEVLPPAVALPAEDQILPPVVVETFEDQLSPTVQPSISQSAQQDHALTELAGLRERVAVLERAIQDIQQGTNL